MIFPADHTNNISRRKYQCIVWEGPFRTPTISTKTKQIIKNVLFPYMFSPGRTLWLTPRLGMGGERNMFYNLFMYISIYIYIYIYICYITYIYILIHWFIDSLIYFISNIMLFPILCNSSIAPFGCVHMPLARAVINAIGRCRAKQSPRFVTQYGRIVKNDNIGCHAAR